MPTVGTDVRRPIGDSGENDPGGDQAAGPALLRALFPAAPARPGAPEGSPGGARRAARAVGAHAAALAAGAAVMLARIPGHPWDTIYNEDRTVYLAGALARPWHLLDPYGGYVQPAPRLVAQLAVQLLPLRLAAVVFALTGALAAAACAVVVFHASAGHIRSAPLRALAAAAVLLLPVAPLEIADSTVNTMWYLIMALFWAVLWRPRTRTGMAAAAAVSFLAASAQPLVLLLAPLLAARAAVLRRPRDHAVTLGWAAGLLVQLLGVIGGSPAPGQSRVSQPVPAGHALAFYADGVAQSAAGWHLGWWLQSAAGHGAAAAIACAVLAALSAWALAASPARTRVFLVAALATGFVFTVAAAGLGYRWGGLHPAVTVGNERGARYATLGIFLIDCAAIVTVDAFLQRRRPGQHKRDGRRKRDGQHGRGGPRGPAWQFRPCWRLAPVLVLATVLAAGWATDFRFPTARSDALRWAPYLASWENTCAAHPAGAVWVKAWKTAPEPVPCARIRDSPPG